MNCKKADILISASIDGELGVPEQKQLDKHIGECSSCKKKLESMRVLSDQMRGLSRIDGDLASRNRVIASLHDQISKEPAPKQTYVFRIPAYAKWIAASAVVVAVLIAFVLNPVQITIGPYEINPPNTSINAPDPWEDAFINGMAQYMEIERVHASEAEVFAEPVAGVFVAQPVDTIDGAIEGTNETVIPAQG